MNFALISRFSQEIVVHLECLSRMRFGGVSLLSSEPGDIEHHKESRGETLKEGLVPAMFGNAKRFMPLFGQSLR